MMKKIGFIGLFLFGLLMQVSAQENAISKAINNKSEIKNSVKETEEKNYKLWQGWNVGLAYGITKFRGDISQYDHYPAYQEAIGFSELKTALSVFSEKRINSFFTLGAEFSLGSFSGLRRKSAYEGFEVYDPYNAYEGMGDKFVTSYYELDLVSNISLTNTFSQFFKAKKGRKIIYDAKLGFGYNMFRNVRRNLISDSPLYGYGYNDELIYEEKKNIFSSISETVYIFGVRANYKLNAKINLLIEYTVRNGLTDKWDASIMSTQYANDNFALISAGISYKIGNHDFNDEWLSPIDVLKDDVSTLNIKIEGFTDDLDNDGVADAFDKSPNTPLGVPVDGSGNALDVDMDNVPDYRDADPFSNRGVLVDANGLELDDDKDGVPNSKDLESNTLVGTMVNQFGMNISNTVHTNGGGMIYFPSIYFNSGSAIVGSSNENRIATIALILKNNVDISLKAIGHTDKVGNTKFNKELGLKRAKAVINYLVSNYNIDAKRLHAITKGEEEPLSKFTTINNGIEESSGVNTITKINRRVDFEITD